MFPVEPSRRSPRKTAVMALLLGLVIGLPLGEGLARLAFERLDYLLPERVPDDLLGFRVAPYSGRHDAWGFRNRRVPERVDIVTIGDSQTYGWASRWRGAWPTRLEERGGASVYNMAMGGFGPGQYLALMDHYVPRLDPTWVVLGLFPANDLIGAWQWVYSDGRNPELRAPSDGSVPATPTAAAGPAQTGPSAVSVRRWLSSHSVFYRASMHTIVGEWARRAEHAIAASATDGVLAVNDANLGVHTLLQPLLYAPALDPADSRVRAGLAVTMRVLARFRDLCRVSDLRCTVAIVPSKERVYAEVALAQPSPRHADSLSTLVRNEGAIVDTLTDEVEDLRLPWVDLFPVLKAGVGSGIYQANRDIHLSERGNELVAEAIWEHIESRGGVPQR